jgi:hypothetical protein
MHFALALLACSSGLKPADLGDDTGAAVAAVTTTAETEPLCGDGLRQAGEECDGDDFSGQSCLDLGFNTGELVCTPGCLVSTVNCSNRGDCANTCVYAEDGECDDGGPGATSSVCEVGTDCADCGYRLCEDSCTWAADGSCDDGGAGSEDDVCTYGTDCADCGVR